jgi:hypothetical protein
LALHWDIHEVTDRWYKGARMVAVTMRIENYRPRATRTTCRLRLFGRTRSGYLGIVDQRFKTWWAPKRTYHTVAVFGYWAAPETVRSYARRCWESA